MAVPQPEVTGQSPVELLRQLQELIGAEAVARWCAGLLAGTARPDDPDAPPLGWFGSGAATLAQRGDLEHSSQGYWVRVWAARGLLHGWDESVVDVAVPAIVGALHDDAWRVREMAAKVVRRWRVHQAADGIIALLKDDVPRVRAAAGRAQAELARTTPSKSRPDRSTARAPKSRPGRSTARATKSGPSRRKPTARRRRKPVQPDDLDTASNESVEALRRGVDQDWSVSAGTVKWDCRRTCAHISDDLIAYAVQLAGQVPSGYLPFRFGVSRGTSPDGLLNLVEATAAVLAATVRVAPADARGWHGYGVADAEGFLAMGVAELVLHSHDIATGLGLAYEPSPSVCKRVVARLCPAVEPDGEPPFTLLLWASGRRDLPSREPVKRWRWQPAPLAEQRQASH